MKKLFAALAATLVLATPAATMHRFGDIDTVPAAYPDVVQQGFGCKTKSDLITEVVHIKKPIDRSVCTSFNSMPPFGAVITPVEWVPITNEAGAFDVLVGTATSEQGTFWLVVDYVRQVDNTDEKA